MDHASQVGVAIVRGRGIEAVLFGTHVDVPGPRRRPTRKMCQTSLESVPSTQTVL